MTGILEQIISALLWIGVGVLVVSGLAAFLFYLIVVFSQPTKEERRRRNESFVWSDKGMKKLISKNYEDALYCFNMALELDSTNGSAWYGLAKIHESRGEYDKALEYFDKATQYNDWRNYWEEKGDLLAKMGRYREALSAYDRAIYLGTEYDEERLEEKKRRIMRNM